MKRLFVFAVLVALGATSTVLAQTIQVAFGWDSHIVQRTGTVTTPEGTFRNDTNRFDMTVPLLIGDNAQTGLVVKGVGQVFAPRHFWRFYDWYYNGDSANQSARDQDYIDQFKGVQAWILDSVRMAVYHNSDNPNPASPGQLNIYRMPTDYRNDRNSDSGISYARSALDENNLIGDPFVMDRDALLNTVTENGAIVPTTLTFDPPLEFGKEESVMLAYINDFATPVNNLVNNDTREFQRVIGYMEFQSGDSIEVFSNPVPNDNVHGVILAAEDGQERFASTFRALRVGTRPYLTNFNVIWFGVVELDTLDLPMPLSVRYHFGTDATDQGLQDVTPNPVRDEATIPFSLTETANVTMDLFTSDGRQVMNMLTDKKYVAGTYSIHMDATDLESGSYIIRMTANDKAYSMKFVVTK